MTHSSVTTASVTTVLATTVLVTIADETTTVEIIDDELGGKNGIGYEFRCGVSTLHSLVATVDPPRPEDLTNAIGLMMDHLDDAMRELAIATPIRVVIAGLMASTVAAVELGSPLIADTFELDRDAAEDVFRTLATEPADSRRHNPGLPPELVDCIPAGCCALVAILRGLKVETATVRAGHTEPESAGGPP